MIIIRTVESCPQAYSLSKQRLSTRYYERPTLNFLTTHIEHRLLLKKTENNPEPKGNTNVSLNTLYSDTFFPSDSKPNFDPLRFGGQT
jgi:hypothetical protein